MNDENDDMTLVFDPTCSECVDETVPPFTHPEHGKPPPAYYEGVKDGIAMYAIWRNGAQYVGVLQRPIKDVFADVDKAAERGAKWVFLP